MAKHPHPLPPAHLPQPRSQPEKKFGPYRGGIGVAVWLNTVQTDEAPRRRRSITIAPRRYYDREAEAWRDTYSFRPSDLPLLLVALNQALEYVFTTPVPGEEVGAE